MHTIAPFDNQEQPDQNENNSLLASIIQSSDDAIIGEDLNGTRIYSDCRWRV